MKRLLVVILACIGLAGCAPSIKVSEPLTKGAKVAVVQFNDCTTGALTDCKGSGAIASKVYSEILGNCPIITSEADSTAKAYDLLVTGDVLQYNIGTPFLGRVNYAKVTVKVKRVADGKVIAMQEDDNSASPTYGKKTEQLVRGFAEDLKEKIGL